MTSSDKIARKQRGSQMHKEFQLVRIPRRERIEIERGLREMDFERYYKMRIEGVKDPKTGDLIYVDPEGNKHVLETYFLPVMLSHGNLAMRSVEHDALMNILGRVERVEALAIPRGHRMCGGCGRVLPLTDEYFHRNRRKKDGFQTWCKDDMGAAARKQYSNRKRKKA